MTVNSSHAKRSEMDDSAPSEVYVSGPFLPKLQHIPMFSSELRPEVVILKQIFKVTLCAATPLQCLNC